MARGGRRTGTPGKAYSNRTDLMQHYATQAGTQTAATGGLPAPPPVAAPVSAAKTAPPPQGQTPISPDQVTPLDAPTNRPTEPVTAGLPSGAGVGPSDPMAQHNADLQAMVRHLPWLTKAAQQPGTPLSVVNFVRFLQSQVTS